MFAPTPEEAPTIAALVLDGARFQTYLLLTLRGEAVNVTLSPRQGKAFEVVITKGGEAGAATTFCISVVSEHVPVLNVTKKLVVSTTVMELKTPDA